MSLSLVIDQIADAIGMINTTSTPARRLVGGGVVVDARGRVKLTIEPEAGHNSWNQPYHDLAFFGWLIQQRRSAPGQPPTTRP